MGGNHRVMNISRNFSLKHRQAEKGVLMCAFAWVDYGISVRDLSKAEKITKINQQASERELLACSELPGITFKPPTGTQAAYINERRQAFEADKFYSLMVQ